MHGIPIFPTWCFKVAHTSKNLLRHDDGGKNIPSSGTLLPHYWEHFFSLSGISDYAHLIVKLQHFSFISICNSSSYARRASIRVRQEIES